MPKPGKYTVDGEQVRAWEKQDSWNNPFEEESVEAEQVQPKKRKSRKKGRKHVSVEESSQADHMLDDILGDEDDVVQTPPKGGSNPFDDQSVDQTYDGQEIDREGYKALLKGKPEEPKKQKESSNPFEEDTVVSALETVNMEDNDEVESEIAVSPNDDEDEEDGEDDDGDEEADDEASSPEEIDDDSSIEAPDGYKKQVERGKNPFEEDSIKNGKETKKRGGRHSNPASPKKAELTDRTATDSFDTAEPKEEDIVMSSKRLLEMAGQRMQYQQHNDEIKSLRDQIETMKKQAEAMSEQLRRAVETKCDLVLAQTELERSHEQEVIGLDDELQDMKHYVQEIMEKQALNELNFMNEIASLAKKLHENGERHKKELAERDQQIAHLQMSIQTLKTGSVRDESSRAAFKNRFLDNPLSNMTAVGFNGAPSHDSVIRV